MSYIERVRANLPDDIKGLPRFVLWAYDKDKNGNLTKVPYCQKGKRASTKNPATWNTFDGVIKLYEQGNGYFSGIGVVLGDGLAGIDCDNVIDAEGNLDAEAREVLETVPGYVEITPSGRGLHILTWAALPKDRAWVKLGEKGKPKGEAKGFEFYDETSPRYLTITGDVFEGRAEMNESDASEQIAETYWRIQKKYKPQGEPVPIETARRVGTSCGYMSDAELLDKARTAKNGQKFISLFDKGDISGYPSRSEAIGALLFMLAFWTGKDESRMDELFRQSALFDAEKWDRSQSGSTWGAIDIKSACEKQTEVYEPNYSFSSESSVDKQSLHIPPTRDAERYKPCDMGNGYLFADNFKDNLRYSPDKKQWLVYDGARWCAKYGDGKAREAAKKLVGSLWQYVKHYSSETQKEYVKNILALQNVHKREAMLKDAQSVYPLTADKLDADTNLFNCLNGTLNLTTGELMAHNASDMITKLAPVRYDPGMKYPLWSKTLAEIFEDDLSKIEFLQRWYGYTLLGVPQEECLLIMHGESSRNGKGTIVSTVGALFGDYAATATPETLEAKQHRDSSKPSEDLARLAGIRLLSISEPDKGMRFDAAKVKTLTGRDTIVARNLHEKSFEYVPQFTININTNYRPRIDDTTLFSSGRIHLLPFERHFAEHEQDKTLKDKLRAPNEMSGILNWILEGLRLYHRLKGLNPPKSVKAATTEYNFHSDKIAQFLNECTEPNPHKPVASTEIYAKYQEWCANNGFRSESSNNFITALTAKGYKKRRERIDGHKNAVTLVYGLTLQD